MADDKLPKEIFNVDVKNYELIDLAYKSYLAGGRAVSATTLKRGEVRGGGRKPWKQKGTGRARIGSIRAPHWRGGGVVFGPNGNENYSLNLSKTMRRVAIKQALSLANKSKQVQVAEFKLKAISTKAMMAELDKLSATSGRILIVLAEPNEVIAKSASNLPGVQVYTAMHINVFNIMNADHIIIEPGALTTISSWLGGKQ